MKKALFFTLVIFSLPVFADSFPKKLNYLLHRFDESLNVGILVQDAKTGKVIFKKNADRYFTPASNQKLLTAFAALNYLPANFTYQTTLFMDKSKIQNGVLNDDIYFQFLGDPTLTITQLDKAIQLLSQAGIKTIHGRLIIDDEAFDQATMSLGTTWEDKFFCWGSPISALTINHNCVSATITPSFPDQLATLTLPDYPQSMQFINQVVTRNDATACAIKANPIDENTYALTGCIKSSDKPKSIEMAINQPRINTQFLLNYLFQKHQIKLDYGMTFKGISKIPPIFAIIQSAPLSSLVTTMLKESDNTIADSLFKTLGAQYTHEAGSFQNGSLALREILNARIQLMIPNTTLIDGAGGSRYNFLTPQQLVTLLQRIYNSTNAPLFINALPISGIDGTLKDRMKDEQTRGKVRAKTGTETAVTSLSGYIETKQKRVLVFSIMINGFVDLPSKYKKLEDAICAALIEAY